MRLYIAGPMTGLPEHNRPAFHAAEAELRAAGYDVLNPARHEVDPSKTWADYMRLGLRDVTEVDGLALLHRWHGSRGASREVQVAQWLGIPTGSVSAWLLRAES